MENEFLSGMNETSNLVERRERESGTILALESTVSNDEKSLIDALFSAVPKDEGNSALAGGFGGEFKTDQEGIRRLPTTAAYMARLREDKRRLEMQRRSSRAPTPLRELSAMELRIRLKEHGFIELAEHLFQDRVNGKMFEFFDTDILENIFDLKHCIKRRDLLGWIRSGSIL
tara:strand:- start:1418 stop:1936 length:519 start_codon:yes stop_codon:yes gene_type:complete